MLALICELGKLTEHIVERLPKEEVLTDCDLREHSPPSMVYPTEFPSLKFISVHGAIRILP